MDNANLTRNNSCTLLLRVRYQECDAQGIVFNARYGDYADIADTEYFRHLVGDFREFNANGFDKRVISYQINWTSPAFFDDVLHLQCRTVNVGNTSYTVQIECSREQDDALQVVADIKITYVLISVESAKKTSIPSTLREGFLSRFNAKIDQTGR